MRIGIFTDQYYPFVSGVVTSIKMLYEGLTELGHECFIFTSYDEKKYPDVEEIKSKNVINIPGRPYPFKDLKDYRYTFTHKRYLKIVKKYNLDIIHVHTEYNISKLAILVHKKLHIPLVHTFHTLWSDYFKYVSPFFDKHFHKQMEWLLRKWFTGPISKNSEVDIVPTIKVKEQAKKYALGKDIRIVPTGINLDRFHPKNFTVEAIENLKNQLNIPKEAFVYVYVGRTSKEKNIQRIIQAFSKLETSAILLIAGGGPDLENLRKLAVDLNLQDKIRFTDIIPWEEIPIYYQLGNVFINASQSETQGLTYIEALGSGIPVLVQKDDCIRDVVLDGKNGIFFDGEEDLAIQMNKVIQNPQILEELKENTLSSIQKYSKEEYCKNILKIYEEVYEKYHIAK